MSESYLKNVVEAALLAAGRPLQVNEIVQLFDEHVRPTPAEVRAALVSLASDYEGRGIELKETATGFRIQVRRELANEISRLWPERPPRYSRALLETLALIAYRQPITRAEIEAVRGVSVNPNIIKTLIERNWVRVVGHREVPGRPELLGTTKEFLDYFGLKSLDELPPLSELKAMGDINLQLNLEGSSSSPSAGSAAGGEEQQSAAASEERQPATQTESAAPEASPASESEAVTTAESSAEAEASAEEEPAHDASAQEAPEQQETPAQEAVSAQADAEEESAEEREAAEDEELSAAPDESRELVAAPARWED
ncbi:MAG: SMC-Scp complex subunit ScpB [Pseudomonadota bacterium]|jgi:segregation and condensation protein B|nr:MAG: SMC-Scp complex subunit ScpB [Pseudomonadota bacterium]